MIELGGLVVRPKTGSWPLPISRTATAFGNTWKGTDMNNRMLIIVAIVLLIVILTGTTITCRDSFWDKDKKVLEIKTNDSKLEVKTH